MDEIRVFIYDRTYDTSAPGWQLVVKRGFEVYHVKEFSRLIDAYEYANILKFDIHNEQALPLRQRKLF